MSCSRKPTQRELASQQNLHLTNAQIQNNKNKNNNRKSAFVQQQQQETTFLSDDNKPPSTMNYTNSSSNSNNSNKSMNNDTSNNNNNNNSNMPYSKIDTKRLITERNLTKIFNNSNNNKNNNINNKNNNKMAATVKKQDNTDCVNQVDNKNNLFEIEESCLLGIDCNEKTTVGLVLRILGDTTIRLDGDG